VGAGVEGASIQQVRNSLVDRQIQNEAGIEASLEKQQSILNTALSNLSITINRQNASATAESSSVAAISGGLYDGINGLFQSFQDLSTQPTSPEVRQELLSQSTQLAAQFNQTDQRLNDLSSSLDESIKTDLSNFNGILTEITKLNRHIAEAEFGNPGSANDLRNTRQQKLEELSKIAKFEMAENDNGMLDISINGVALVEGAQAVQSLESYTNGAGNLKLRTSVTGDEIEPASGSIHGTIEARDGALSDVRNRINQLATALIDQVNAIHMNGYSLTGSTGENYFEGTDAASIKVNAALSDNPELIQASGTSGARSDNSIALSLAQLGSRPVNTLGNLTFNQHLSQTVTSLSQSLASVNNELEDQQVISSMLERQRDSISGVSVDEEMTDMMKFQKAFEASARLINTIDEMLDTVIGLKR
jgi:flagellar hook-associated protein 1 FlgK